MIICIIASGYPNEDGIGGTFVEQLVNAFVRQGNRCTVISPLNIYYDPKLASLYNEYEEKLVDGKNKVCVYRPRTNVWNIPLIPISTTRHAAQKAIEHTIEELGEKFDCIYCHFFASGILAWHYAHKHNIPLFVATGESKILERFQFPCLSFSWSKFKRDTNGVICVSSKNYEECIERGFAEKEKCKVFPNGVDLQLFKPLNKRECRNHIGLADEDFLLITVGEFSDRKGQNRIIKAVDNLSNASIKTCFIGSGEAIDERSFIFYKGKVKHTELPIYLNAADVFVLPTLREGCCNAIVEALACGLPVISSDRKFNYDILDETNSIMVDPENINQISMAIKALYDNNEKRQNLSKGAVYVAKSLSIDQRAENICTFIRERINNTIK